MTKKHLHTVMMCVAILGGVGLAFVPGMTRNWPESGPFGVLRTGINSLSLPGIVVGMIIAGDVHLISKWVLYASNVVFYSGAVYLILRAWARRRTADRGSEDWPS
jgi:hypothetical protein